MSSGISNKMSPSVLQVLPLQSSLFSQHSVKETGGATHGSKDPGNSTEMEIKVRMTRKNMTVAKERLKTRNGSTTALTA